MRFRNTVLRLFRGGNDRSKVKTSVLTAKILHGVTKTWIKCPPGSFISKCAFLIIFQWLAGDCEKADFVEF